MKYLLNRTASNSATVDSAIFCAPPSSRLVIIYSNLILLNIPLVFVGELIISYEC